MSSQEPGSAPDLGAILSQLGQVREAVQAAQHDAADRLLQGSAGGGKVRVQTTGGLDFRSVTIDPSVVDPDDVEMLADLVLAAVRDAVEQANAAQAQALGGFDLGNIQGLLGG